ncbi:MAG: hypothetical protein M1119_00930 [Firmicutes bacterium]|nr:hypothetical protein [Bacillota bacterium]
MKISLDIPWHQYALIVTLAEKMHEKGYWFGKTALQKLVYLLGAIYKVPCGYQFSLYIHGPFCSELTDDLDYMNALGGVSVNFDPRVNGYSISPAPEREVIKSKAEDFLATHQSQIDKLLDDFGSMKARDLELRSTIVFVDRAAQREKRNLTRKEFIQEIHSIKPHFSVVEIESAVAELEGKGYVVRREE